MSGDPEHRVAATSRATPTVDLGRWQALVADVLRVEAAPPGAVDVLFVDPSEMAELNETHLGKAGPTDVLSFPLDVDADDPLAALERHLGDLVVCPQVAAAQAPDHAGSVDAELTLLLVHGVLHLLGHDHAEPGEAAVMRAREAVHLERRGFTHPGAWSR